MKIHTIRKKMEVTWREDVKAIVDTWQSYFVTQFQFEQAILIKGLNHAKENGGVAWIVDSSNAIGAMPKFMIELIDTKVFPAFVESGIKYFITVSSGSSKMANKTIAQYSEKTHHNGLILVKAESLDDAINWLKNNA